MLALSSSEFSSLIERLKSNTTSFLDSIDSINEKVTAIDDSMVSIRKSTQRYSEQKVLFERVTGDIEKVQYFLNTASSVTPIVYNDLRINKPISRQPLLFESLNRLADTGKFFAKYKLKIASADSESEVVNKVFQDVVKICLDAFQDSVRIIKASHDIHIFENETIDSSLRFAKEISNNLELNMIDSHYKIYEKARLEILMGSPSSSTASSSGQGVGGGNNKTNRGTLSAGMSNTHSAGNYGVGRDNVFTSMLIKSPEKRATTTTNDAHNKYTRPTIANFEKRKSLNMSENDSNQLWEMLLADLPYHKDEGPFQLICESCLLSLKIEHILWSSVFSTIQNKAIQSFSVIASKILNLLTQTFPTMLQFHGTDEKPKQAATKSSHSTSSSSTASAGSAMNYTVLRQVNIMLCRLDILDIYLRNSEDFREILLKSGVRCESLLIGNHDQTELTDKSAAHNMTTLIDLRNKFVSAFFKSCDDLLKCKWDYGAASTVADSSTNSTNRGAFALGRDTFALNAPSRATFALNPVSRATFVPGSDTGGNPSKAMFLLNSNNHEDSNGASSSSAGSLTCDAHSVTVAIVHGCKVLSSFSESLYDDQLLSIANHINAVVPAKATSLRLLILTLIDLLMKKLDLLGAKLNPPENTKKMRSLETGHAKYTSGDTDAVQCLKWAQIHLFYINNYFGILSYITEINRESTKASSEFSRLGESLARKISAAKTEFVDCVAYALTMSPDDMMTFNTSYIKENTQGKYKILKGMSALENMKDEWRLASPLLSQGLTDELVLCIAPIYSDFFSKYSQIEFSKKHMSEYLVYLPNNVERFLLNFFD